MSAEDKEIFQLSGKCWVCDTLFDVEDDKVRDLCHVTGKYRGSAYCSCNVNLKLTKKSLQHFIIQGIMAVIYSCKKYINLM